MTKLKKILERTAQYGFSWSMFTNGLYWDETLDQYLKSGQLFVTVQYNSRRPEVIAEMMGVSLESAATHLRNRLHLQALAKHLNECHIERTGVSFAGVAASMVPERGNLDEIMDMIDEANRHGMFPSIGELERAGHSTGEYYESHKLEKHELQVLHQRIEQRFGVQYERPICPAAIGAIHVNNRGIVTVDKFTGLTCNWFGMKDPEVYEIGDIRKMRRSEITRAILEYRESRIGEVRKSMNDYYPETVFGGCGGKARKMLAKYVSLYD